MRQSREAERQRGFTLPELISVMAVTVMFSSLIMYFAFQYWRSTATLSNSLETFVSRLNSGDRLRDAINFSSGTIIQNSIEDSNASNPDPDITSNTFWVPIHAVPGTTSVPAVGETEPLLYFRAPSVDSSKNIIFNGVQPYEDEFVLYLDGTTKKLYLRTLASEASGNSKQTSCPPSLATSNCPTDRVMGESLSAVDMRYFSRSGLPIDHHSSTDPITGEYTGPDFPAVEVVEFTLTTYKKSTLHGGADATSQTVIRIALRNS